MSYTAPRGTYDYLPAKALKVRELVRRAAEVLETYGFSPIETPIFESSELFNRAIGEQTDIVSKEMYTFKDRKERSLTLRPEGTAGVVRAYVENKLDQTGLERFWYFGPMFRYERPQAGRQRQFNQLGVEVFGDAGPVVDAEVIELFIRICEAVGLEDLKVQLNSLGCGTCKADYSRTIQDVVGGEAAALCADCQVRVERNPLRILDCKNPSCAPVLERIPAFIDRLCAECRPHFAAVQQLLDQARIPYELNRRLVRGLDYYTRTAFEIQIPGARGAQNAIGGGGRYDLLVEQMGGKPTPGIGFAFGVERMLNLLEDQKVDITPAARPIVYVAWMGDAGRAKAMALASSLRAAGVSVRVDGGTRSLGKQFQAASRLGARVAAILGEDEVARATVGLKNLETRDQVTVPWADAVERIRETLGRSAGQKGVTP